MLGGAEREWSFGIVIPCLDAAQTIDETIESVVTQRGDFTIRLHVQDGGSTDGTVERVRAWQRRLEGAGWPWRRCRGVELTCSVASDDGPHEALNTAFGDVRGDAYTWLGGDDRLERGALQAVSTLFRQHLDVRWVTGAVSLLHEDGVIPATDPGNRLVVRANPLPRRLVAAGHCDSTTGPLVQQEGTFWTESLWELVGRRVRTDLDYAFDFDLWTRFAQVTAPVTTLASLGRFRRRLGQLSASRDRYFEEVALVQAELRETGHPAPWAAEGNGRLAHIDANGGWAVYEAASDSTGGLRRFSEDSGVGWVADEGINCVPEGPFEDLGIPNPFFWITSRRTKLTLAGRRHGPHRIAMVLRNPHLDQQVRITGPALDLRLNVPVSSVPERPWRVTFPLELEPEGTQVVLHFSRSERPEDEDRDLTAMLLDLTGERYGREAPSPVAPLPVLEAVPA